MRRRRRAGGGGERRLLNLVVGALIALLAVEKCWGRACGAGRRAAPGILGVEANSVRRGRHRRHSAACSAPPGLANSGDRLPGVACTGDVGAAPAGVTCQPGRLTVCFAVASPISCRDNVATVFVGWTSTSKMCADGEAGETS